MGSELVWGEAAPAVSIPLPQKSGNLKEQLLQRWRKDVPLEVYFDKLRVWSPESYRQVLAIIRNLEKTQGSLGGRLLAIGGMVRDSLEKLDSRYVKDIDFIVEVYDGYDIEGVNEAVKQAIEDTNLFTIEEGVSPIAGHLNDFRPCLRCVYKENTQDSKGKTQLHFNYCIREDTPPLKKGIGEPEYGFLDRHRKFAVVCQI